MQPLKVIGFIIIVGAIIKMSIIGFYTNELPFIVVALVVGYVLTKMGERAERASR